jgi:hypothetical protein
MSGNQQNTSVRATLRRSRFTVAALLEIGALAVSFWLVSRYTPFARLFGFEGFEQRHGLWPEFVITATGFSVVKSLYGWLFRREQQRAERAAFREALVQRRVKRMPLAGRSALMLLALALVIGGSLMRSRDGTSLLVFGVPMLLLAAAAELNIVLHPGDALIPDPHDELLMFFRSRMLAAGYSVAVLSIAALYVVSLFELRYVEMLLPVVLALTVLVPGLVYRRLDRRAGADE